MAAKVTPAYRLRSKTAVPRCDEADVSLKTGVPSAMPLDHCIDLIELQESGHHMQAADDVHVGKIIADLLHGDVTLEVAATAADAKLSCGSHTESHICRFCPFRALRSAQQLCEHIKKFHTEDNMFICSGKRQKRIVFALYDADCLGGGKIPFGLLARSAACLRTNIRPPLPSNVNYTNKMVRMVLTGTGPKLVNRIAVGGKGGISKFIVLVICITLVALQTSFLGK